LPIVCRSDGLPEYLLLVIGACVSENIIFIFIDIITGLFHRLFIFVYVVAGLRQSPLVAADMPFISPRRVRFA